MMNSHSVSLLANLVKRDLKERYIGTTLGWFWLLLHPILLMIIYTFVFSYVLNVRFDTHSESDLFVFYLMAGLLAFNAFAEAVTRASSSLINHRHLLLNSPLPAWMLPTVPVLSTAVIEALSILLLVSLFFIWHGEYSNSLWLYPLILLIRMIFTLAISHILSITTVFIRDISQGLPMALMLLMLASPIVYPLSLVPEDYLSWYSLNIFTHFAQAYRAVLLESTLPWKTLMYLSLIAILSLWAAATFFKKTIEKTRYVL